MTDPVIRLDSDRVAVEPGGQAQVGITVSNPGSIVEGYTLDVLGEGPASWAQVIPAELSVYPQQEARAIVTFSPPSGNAAPSGTSAFAVRARSTVDPDISAVAEGDVEIGKVFGLQAKIVPVTSAGRWRGRHVVQLSNWGNSPATLRLVASDPDAALGFYVRPDVVELPLGGSATVRMSVRTRKPFLRGSPVRLPFTVVAERADGGVPAGPTPATPYADPSRPVVDGALNQKPILSAGFVALLGLVLLAVLGLVGYLLVLRPGPTPGELDRPPPDAPAILDAKALRADAVEVTWEPMTGVAGFKVLVSENEKIMPPTSADGVQSVAVVETLLPGTDYCFRVVAEANDRTSPPSDEECVRTLPASASASPTPAPSSPPSGSASPPASAAPPTSAGPVPPGGTPPPGTRTPDGPSTGSPPDGRFAGGAWVAVPFFTIENAAAESSAQTRRDRLEQAAIESFVINYPRDFPTMTGPNPLTAASVLLAVGPFDSQADAEAACPRIIAATGDPRCFYFQPQP